VIYFTARDLADALMPRAITAGRDMKDGYRISVFGSGTSELVSGLGVVGFDWVYPSHEGYSESESDGEEQGEPRRPRLRSAAALPVRVAVARWLLAVDLRRLGHDGQRRRVGRQLRLL
jgi:hypothetical protein